MSEAKKKETKRVTGRQVREAGAAKKADEAKGKADAIAGVVAAGQR